MYSKQGVTHPDIIFSPIGTEPLPAKFENLSGSEPYLNWTSRTLHSISRDLVYDDRGLLELGAAKQVIT